MLVWGATGGLGSFAVQYVLNGGGTPVGVVSIGRACRARCATLGCEHVIDRPTPATGSGPTSTPRTRREWRRLGADIRALAGEDPDIVFEHPGRQTMGASVFVCKRGGTVVTCAATTGYMIEYDNRHLWMKLKTIKGSHFSNYREAWAANQLVCEGRVVPPLRPCSRSRRWRGGVAGAPEPGGGQARGAVRRAKRGARRRRPRPARPVGEERLAIFRRRGPRERAAPHRDRPRRRSPCATSRRPSRGTARSSAPEVVHRESSSPTASKRRSSPSPTPTSSCSPRRGTTRPVARFLATPRRGPPPRRVPRGRLRGGPRGGEGRRGPRRRPGAASGIAAPCLRRAPRRP